MAFFVAVAGQAAVVGVEAAAAVPTAIDFSNSLVLRLRCLPLPSGFKHALDDISEIKPKWLRHDREEMPSQETLHHVFASPTKLPAPQQPGDSS